MGDSYIVYMHKCLVTGKAYIGYTKHSIDKRWLGHVYVAEKVGRKDRRCHFQNAIKKHGLDAWEHVVLKSGIPTLEEACSCEIQMISEHKTLAPDGYNETTGGKGINLTPEARQRHKERTKEALNRPDIKAKMCAAQKIAHNTPESRIKNSVAQKIAQNLDSVREKKRIKMFEHCSREDYVSPRSKPVLQFGRDGVFIAEHESATEASRATNTNQVHLCEAARGARNRSGGFYWKYKELCEKESDDDV